VRDELVEATQKLGPTTFPVALPSAAMPASPGLALVTNYAAQLSRLIRTGSRMLPPVNDLKSATEPLHSLPFVLYQYMR
jgi:hypothetical protein